MGKMLLMICVLIFVDMVVLASYGALNCNSNLTISLNSALINIIRCPQTFDLSDFFANNILSILASLIAGATVAATFYALGGRSETIVYAGFASAVLFDLVKDYIFIYQKLQEVNTTLAAFIAVPFIAIFAFVVIDWLKGRD